MTNPVIDWLLQSDEPWTRYRTRLDLLDLPITDPNVQADRAEMLAHPHVQTLIDKAATWGETPFKRHNDAKYPIYAFSTLADFGLCADDPGLNEGIERVMAHHSAEGAFQSVVNIPKAFGGNGEDQWTWILCDTPTLLYSLLAMGLADDSRVKQAVEHLIDAVDDNGWRCVAAPELGKFKGPGRRTDPCPIVNVFALKALSLLPELVDSDAVRAGAEMLLSHGAGEGKKFFLFGAGTDYRKLKYPYVWYNVLHVVEVLSRFPFTYTDKRLEKLLQTIIEQADADGHYTANSMYLSWKGWSFSNKKTPSPWLTFLVERIRKRMVNGE